MVATLISIVLLVVLIFIPIAQLLIQRFQSDMRGINERQGLRILREEEARKEARFSRTKAEIAANIKKADKTHDIVDAE